MYFTVITKSVLQIIKVNRYDSALIWKIYFQVLNENFGNQLDLYEKNLTWLTCPEGRH